MNIICDPSRITKQCRVCDARDLKLAIDLGYQPWCGHFLKKEELGTEPFYPLRVVFCGRCSTPQLDYTVPKEVMFAEHTYLSNITKTLSDHFKKLAEELTERFFKDKREKTILDIGSNDGMQLSHYKNLGWDVLGVESAKTVAEIANKAGIPTERAFFNLAFSRKLNRKFDAINASGVFFHLEELHSAAEAIRELLKDDGIFMVQFLYMKRIVENRAFDQIYHEHLLYYTLKNIEILLNRHGMSMFDAYVSPIHGGSVVGFITHQGKREASRRLEELRQEEMRDKSNELNTYQEFAERIKKMKEENLSYLKKAKGRGKKIFGLGAPAKGNTMLNYFGVGKQDLDYLVEKNELRKGLYAPGSHIPIVMEDELKELPNIYYGLAWNFKREILAKNQHLVKKGVEFFFPVDPKET